MMETHTSPCENLIEAIKDVEAAKANGGNLEERVDRHHAKIETICEDIHGIKIRLAIITFASSCVGALFGGVMSKIFESRVDLVVSNWPK